MVQEFIDKVAEEVHFSLKRHVGRTVSDSVVALKPSEDRLWELRMLKWTEGACWQNVIVECLVYREN